MNYKTGKLLLLIVIDIIFRIFREVVVEGGVSKHINLLIENFEGIGKIWWYHPRSVLRNMAIGFQLLIPFTSSISCLELIWLIRLAREVSPASLTAPCTSFLNLHVWLKNSAFPIEEDHCFVKGT